MGGEEGAGRGLEQGMGLVLNLILDEKGMTDPRYWVLKPKQD